MDEALNIVRLEILRHFEWQGDFAKNLGCHESKVSQVLRGRRKLKPADAAKWLEILRCDPAVLSPVTKVE